MPGPRSHTARNSPRGARQAAGRARRAAGHAAGPRHRHRPGDQAAGVRGRRGVGGGAPSFLAVVDTVAGLAVAAGAAYFLFRLVRARQAAAAVARPPEADPLLHLHRLRAGHPDRRVLPAVRPAAVLQLQLVPRADAAARAQRAGALLRPEHGARDPAGRRQRRGRHHQPQAGERVGGISRHLARRRAGRSDVQPGGPRRAAVQSAAPLGAGDRGTVGARRRAGRGSVVDLVRGMVRPAGVHDAGRRRRRAGAPEEPGLSSTASASTSARTAPRRTSSSAPSPFPIRCDRATRSSSICS